MKEIQGKKEKDKTLSPAFAPHPPPPPKKKEAGRWCEGERKRRDEEKEEG